MTHGALCKTTIGTAWRIPWSRTRGTSTCCWVVHMDRFVTKARRDFNLGNVVRNLIQIHSGKDARSVGEKLIALHRPLDSPINCCVGNAKHTRQLRLRHQSRRPGSFPADSKRHLDRNVVGQLCL